ncbi:MAG: DUF5092 domain-containing protein [Candidatus Babeliales bacterium]|nr:DUF5092 domain-containing protein [Candidatus Babeliales bacterium]
MKIKLFIALMAIIACYAAEDQNMQDAPPVSSSSTAASTQAASSIQSQEELAASTSSASASASASPIVAQPLSPEQQKQAKFKEAIEALQNINEIPIEFADKTLNINSTESLYRKTFKELIKEHFEQYVPFLIAQVTTKLNGEVIKDYYDAFLLNKNFLVGGYKINAFHHALNPKLLLNRKNPLNQQNITQPIEYYVLNPVSEDPNLFKYIGAEDDMLKRPAEKIFLEAMTQNEFSDYADWLIPVDSDLNPELITKELVEVLKWFAMQKKLNISAQFKLGKFFFNLGDNNQFVYDLLSRLIANPETSANIRSYANSMKFDALSKLSPQEKLQMGLAYYSGKIGLGGRNYKNALELLESGLSGVKGQKSDLITKSKLVLSNIYFLGKAGNQKNYQRVKLFNEELLNSNLLIDTDKKLALKFLINIYGSGGFGVEQNLENVVTLIKRLYLIDPLYLNIDYIYNIAKKLLAKQKYKSQKELLEIILNHPQIDQIDPCVFMNAQYDLAYIYIKGLGFETNRSKAIVLWKSIISNENNCNNHVKLQAYANLADVLFNAKGLKQDLEIAQEYFKIVLNDKDSTEKLKQHAQMRLKQIEVLSGSCSKQLINIKPNEGKPTSAAQPLKRKKDKDAPGPDEKKARITEEENDEN